MAETHKRLSRMSRKTKCGRSATLGNSTNHWQGVTCKQCLDKKKGL